MKKKQVIGKIIGVPMLLKLRIVNIYSVKYAALILFRKLCKYIQVVWKNGFKQDFGMIKL